ncbi:MAG TPA: hypothetical protein VER37_06115, partial [Thermomicrobiales bacterium]|nr:hypothetical protein [Thermomicrobiales bacterium]
MGAPEPLGNADATRRPCRRCRGEGRAPGPPILTPNLVIAARPRNRDPELPAATVEHALTAAMPAEGARYDLVVALPDPENVPALCSVALEFARHEHRVFWLSPAGDAGRAY